MANTTTTSEFDFSKTAESKQKGRSHKQPQAQVPGVLEQDSKNDPGDGEKKAPEEGDGEESKYDQEELLRIFDEIIFTGEYSEEVTIRGKLHVRFRTRTVEEIEQISATVDAMEAHLVATLNDKRSVLNLQYALVSYQGKDLKSLDIADRSKFIRRLPGPIIASLLTAMSIFDMKVFEACKDGEANF